MNEERPDRRVRRTRELLRSALLALILEKGYERVTVQDIIDRADVGRSTFYAHFRDKEDLLVSGMDELRPAFEGLERGMQHGPTLAVFEHASKSHDIYKAMLGRTGAEVVRRHFHQLLTELVGRHVDTLAPAGTTAVPLDMIVEFAVCSLEGLLHWWIDNDLPLPAEQMSALYLKMVEPGINAALESAR